MGYAHHSRLGRMKESTMLARAHLQKVGKVVQKAGKSSKPHSTGLRNVQT